MKYGYATEIFDCYCTPAFNNTIQLNIVQLYIASAMIVNRPEQFKEVVEGL
jgi:hypothetical protein